MDNLSKYIDHTFLKADAQTKDIEEVCKLARQYNTASVCTNPVHTKLVSRLLEGSDVKSCVVVGFPLGANKPEVKAFETKLALDEGAQEIDMVLNIGAMKDRNFDLVGQDIKCVSEVTTGRAVLKVILETCLLTKEEIEMACKIAVENGCDFVKTSTGFSTGGALVEDVELMRQTVGQNIGVKASGGVRTAEDAEKMIKAGANRLGASATQAIVEGVSTSHSDY